MRRAEGNRPSGARTDASEPVVLYIGGEGRSGSTLLASLLGNQPGYFPIGEFRDIWQAVKTDERCGCGQRFSECPFWRDVGQEAFGGWATIDADAMLESDRRFARQRRVPYLVLCGLRRKVRPDALSDYRHVLASLYATVKRVSGCSIIVDSTKDPAYAVLLSGIHGLDVRTVHLVRDSRGVAYSWSKKDVRRPEYDLHPQLHHTYMGSRSAVRAAIHWSAKNFLFDLLAVARPSHFVRYESLIADPSRELADTMAFAQEALAADQDRPAPVGSPEFLPFHSLGGNRVRFERGRIELAADVEWTRKMRRSQRLLVGALTFPLLVAYRYVELPHLTPRADDPRRAGQRERAR